VSKKLNQERFLKNGTWFSECLDLDWYRRKVCTYTHLYMYLAHQAAFHRNKLYDLRPIGELLALPYPASTKGTRYLSGSRKIARGEGTSFQTSTSFSSVLHTCLWGPTVSRFQPL